MKKVLILLVVSYNPSIGRAL